MSWANGDPELEAYVRERQRITIQNYANDPDLLDEHVGMEDNFQAGGYGERQIEELLQNAIDQLTGPGRVELRLADGVLYCANEGSAFDAEGIRAITHAFLSSKKDEKIGRFGLGFKSVLGVTDHPQIISRSVSFGFNGPDARAYFEDLPYRPGRVPTLRVPSVLDPAAIANDDRNIAEMMEWATTIVRLPLVRGGQRLHARIKDFDVRYLLFPDLLARVDLTLDGMGTRTFRRLPGPTRDSVILEEPTRNTTTWRVLHREHVVSPRVRSNLPGLFDRDRVRVSYALQTGQARREIGQFWAWFPLSDETTASGIFNAPWHVNDDRTSMLPGSALNAELLGVAAELLIEAALLESTADDPARHFDVLPARGRETRSPADRYMSDQVPKLARQLELIPTADGGMRAPARVRVPYFKKPSSEISLALPSEAIKQWSDATGAGDTPHWSCYTNATRAARLTQLLTDEADHLACRRIDPASWLSDLAKLRTVDAINAALAIYLRLRQEKQETWSQFAAARILPLEDGTLARAADVATILLPTPGEPAPDQARLVATEFSEDPEVRSKLLQVGVREVSRDQIASAIAATASAVWNDSDWDGFWRALAKASPETATAALHGIRARDLPVKVPTKSGAWREASEVFLDAQSVPGVLARQPDLERVGGRSDLLAASGCVRDLTIEEPAADGKVVAAYRKAMRKAVDARAWAKFGQHVASELRLLPRRGVRLLDILAEISEVDAPGCEKALASWTTRVLELMPSQRLPVFFDLDGGARNQRMELKSPELWCVEQIGLLPSSLGLAPPGSLVAKDLASYDELIPVATRSYAGMLDLPTDVRRIPAAALRVFLDRDDYGVGDPAKISAVLAVVASHKDFEGRATLPALDPRTRRIRLTPLSDIVLAEEHEYGDVAFHNLRVIPSSECDEAIAEVWPIPRAADVIAKAIDWSPSDEAVPILDVYPTLARVVDSKLDDVLLRRCRSIVRRTTGPSGAQNHPLSSYLDGRTVLVDDQLDRVETLLEASRVLRLRLTTSDAEAVIAQDERLRRSQLIQDVVAADTEVDKLLTLVDRADLEATLPAGLLAIIEQRQGTRTDLEVAQLYLDTHGNDALRELREPLRRRGLPVPTRWAGSDEAMRFVTDLGFPPAYAGTREKKNAPIEVVPGRMELRELHWFQKELLAQIRDLALLRDTDGECRRGLLYLPTGAGKTRVTTEALATMMRDGELASPVLWIAQSEELCEQAILSWTEVWRAFGDERPLELTRYWNEYEADESHQELQVVVAIDAKLDSMISSTLNQRAHAWLQASKLVVIDEAHRAGSPRYTAILRWLGLTQGAGARTARPLLGLTATPFRGTNEEVNRQFVLRFGERRLEALDPEDPMAQLREMQVLSKVEHQLLNGIVVEDSPTEGQSGSKGWDDVSKGILTMLGARLDRTQDLVDHIMKQPDEWPILVFTPTVVSAHVTAALIRSLGRSADAVDGGMRGQERRRKIEAFRSGQTRVLVNCDLLTQGFDAPKVRALYIARPTFSPNRYLQMVGRGLRGPANGGTEECLVVNMVDTFTQFDRALAYTEFDYLWTKSGADPK